MSDLPLHIPDEYVEVWNKKSLDDLSEMLDRLEIHNASNTNTEFQETRLRMMDSLRMYIKHRMGGDQSDGFDIIVSKK